ncbi:hypothetical protein PVAND_014592 [Polypedilum vanderplanki]|uniref:Uncharacterized protein n=1 Tax=Polypedilum vanderplanki TaxID=319348 RepID=A0A9J6BAD8_POLVA|nr:hypothetical protein PVAND_014592 [Polypedilum vanderplanki]
MNNRNYGNYSNRNFSPPRSNYSNDYRNPCHSDQAFYQYQNNLQQSQYEGNYNNSHQNYRQDSRFNDYQQKNNSEKDYLSFVDRQMQTYYDRPNRQQEQTQSRNNQASSYGQRRSNQNERRGPSSAATSSRQNNEQPKMKLKFDDVFTIARINEDGSTTYNCKLCKLSNLPENNLQTHVTGKRHKHQLKVHETGSGGSGESSVKMNQFKSLTKKKNIYTHRPSFDAIIGPVSHPLIALTYIVEILDPIIKEPSYVCVLCSKRCDPRTIVNHLISQTHRMNYLERHFPHLITILHNSRRFNEDMEFRQMVLINIAKVLEDSFGRATAFVYDGSDYETTKEIIFDNINKKKHIAQEDIPDVEGVLLEGINFQSTSWEMNNPPKAPIINESPGKKRRITEKIVEDYKNELNFALQELEKKLQSYQRDPESHPFYKKEWELFWNRKVDEVTARGGDVKNYNFQSEWCDFFLDRIKDLHREEVKWKTEQLKRKFSITQADLQESEQNATKRIRNNEDYFNDRKSRFKNDDSDENDEEYTIDTPRIDKAELYVKEKRIFDDFLSNLNPVEQEKPQTLQASSSRSFKAKPSQSSTSRTQNQNDSTTLITTLRLLSSLESELGLLAPRVLDLLSKSLAFEREHPKKSDDLLFDSENLNLIETVKEKILGMQAANLIASNKQTAVQKAINEVEKLIEKHEKMVKVRESLREMGKSNATTDEMEMLMTMMSKDDKRNPSGMNFNYDHRNSKNQNFKQAVNRLRKQR